MIAMDNQPSMVEDRGFIELLPELEPRYVIPSTKYFNETMLPQAYDNLKLKISKECHMLRVCDFKLCVENLRKLIIYLFYRALVE